MVDGVIAIGVSAHHPEVEQLRAAGLPLVMVDSSALPDLPTVEVDDEGGAYAAAAAPHRPRAPRPADRRHRVDPGHAARARRRRRTSDARATGAGSPTSGVELGEDAVVVAPSTIEGGMAALRGAWEDGLRPTGVLVMSDAMAIGVLRAARELGLDVPGEISVVGFDDIDISQHTNPPLTTVHQPIRLKGEAAVRSLLARIDRPDVAVGAAAARDAPDHPRLDRPGGPPMRTRSIPHPPAIPPAPAPRRRIRGNPLHAPPRRLTDRSEESMHGT